MGREPRVLKARRVCFLRVCGWQASPLADALVFNKVKAKLGGRVRLVASGSAPLAPHVEKFLKTAMCAPCCQGYGLTETCGSSFIALPEPVRTRPLPTVVHQTMMM